LLQVRCVVKETRRRVGLIVRFIGAVLCSQPQAAARRLNPLYEETAENWAYTGPDLAWAQLRYDTIRDAVLTCARKPTRFSLIYRTEPTTKKCKNRKQTKSRKQMCSEITVNSPGSPCSEYLRRRKEGLQWEGFAEKEGFKPGKKE